MDANGITSAFRTARWSAIGGARHGQSGPGEILNEWSENRKGPCKCVARKDRMASPDKTAVATGPVRRDLAVVDRWAARTEDPRPAGAMKTGADTVADSAP